MDVSAVLIIMATVFLWALVSARLTRADVTAPIVFVSVGVLLAGVGLVDASTTPETVRPLVEVTLVWVLFSDAARISARDLRRDLAVYVRLLGVGLPVTVLVGWGLASRLLPGLEGWLALVVAAALAPTDAALGVPVVTNPVVPARVRRLITVESGLNDGIVTPVVLLALAGAASAEGVGGALTVWSAAAELLIGALVGTGVGALGGWLLRWASRRKWAAEDVAGVAVLALAIVAYAGAVVAHGNGFVAAFCGGLGFGAAAGRRATAELTFLDQASGLASCLVWLAFGAIAVPVVFDQVDGKVLAYAVLSLTLARMLPVGLATLGSRLDRATVLFVGWFGPRGLASLVFALLALDELGARADEAVAVIGTTVLLSVLAHGLTAGPLAARYGAHARGPEELGASEAAIPVRGLRPPFHHRPAEHGDEWADLRKDPLRRRRRHG